MNEYALQTAVRCDVTFRNLAGNVADPTTVTFYVHDSEGEETDYLYGVDPEIVRVSTGIYYVLVDANKPGTWTYRFNGTGAVKAADEEQFRVLRSVF